MSPTARHAVPLAAMLLAAMVAGCDPGLMMQPSYSPAQPAPVITASGGQARAYLVKPGDTIYTISRETGVPLRSLIDNNGLAAPYGLTPGQTLHIPGTGGYVVERGDTLTNVAKKIGVSFDTLVRLNHLASPFVIRVGQRLQLPATQEGPETFVIMSPRAGQPGAGQPGAVQPGAGQPPAQLAQATPQPRPGVVASALPPPSAPGQPFPAQPSANAQTTTTILSPRAEPGYRTLAERPAESPPPAPLPQAEPPPVPGIQPAAKLPPLASAKPPPTQLATAAQPPAPPPVASPPEPAGATPGFAWPVRGKVIEGYGASGTGQSNDGINIAVAPGTPVAAAADGEVAYAGNELRGYGNLLLIKHPGGWMSAYAHNQTLLVKQGEHVRKGETVARSGDSGGVSPPQLHFELRRGNKAVDPAGLLPKDSGARG